MPQKDKHAVEAEKQVQGFCEQVVKRATFKKCFLRELQRAGFPTEDSICRPTLDVISRRVPKSR